MLVISPSGIEPVASNVGAYADYNDLGDQCNRNSLAIGLRTPQVLPSQAGGRQDVMFNIAAPRGYESWGKISGLIQPVNGIGCVLQPWMSLTDGMGTTVSTNTVRYTLSTDANWTARDRCGNAPDFGEFGQKEHTIGC